MKIVFASTNKVKIREVKDLFLNTEHEIIYLCDCDDVPEPEEPYETFQENAIHKAKYYSKHLKLPSLCDDTGICIQALDGRPGVQSKRFIEESGGLKQAFARLEAMLEGKDRSAQLECSVALHIPGIELPLTSQGILQGELSFPASSFSHGTYDNIFIPHGYDKTLLELGIGVKNEISQRAQAMKQMIFKISQLLS